MSTSRLGRTIWTTKYPELGTGPVPIAPYISSERFERERELIFRRVWLNVGRVEEVPRPGDYFVRELAVCNASVLVARGRDGLIRAFHNVCSHRANRVARDRAGSARLLVCGFHGWSYDPEGRLVYVPDEDQFFDFDKSKHGLTPVAADVWEGFIFINLDPNPKETLAEYLGELGRLLKGYPFGEMPLYGAYRADVRANWKVALNGFQEGYHVPFLHKRSASRAYADKENPFIHALEFKLYKRHRTMSIPGAASIKPTPVEAIAHRFGASITRVSDAPARRLPPGLNPTRSPNWAFDMIIFFPNFFMFLFDGMYFTYHFWPLAVDRTSWETRIYYPKAENAGQRFSQEYAKCALRDTLMEDGNTLEAVQANLASGAKTHFILQDQEILLRHSHKVIEDIVNPSKE